MAGGIWSSQNKFRPGAYINFENESAVSINMSDRGIATMPIALDWGAENSLIELTANDLLTGKSLEKTGLVYTDAGALTINLALQNCRVLKLFNTRTGGTAASKTLTGITITAKYPGVFGNKIAIVITETAKGYLVSTYADGYFVDSQDIASVSELVDNGFVTFASAEGSLAPTASTLLVGGTNGTIPADYTANYFNLLLSTAWNTMAIPSADAVVQAAAIRFIKAMRDEEGKYVQVVLPNADITAADYEGVINSANGVILNDGTTVSVTDFVAWVAGATAGAEVTESLTGRIVDNATDIVGALDNEAIISALKTGRLVLSRNQDGSIKIEKDINSLHNFTADKNYTFSKNRVIRELDGIGSGIENIWEQSYLGKVSNNENGRTLFKSSIINFLTQLQTDGAVDEFDSESVIVEAGEDVDSVVASIAVKPVDSMEILYMTVNVS